jgi:hypothetical protein
MGEDGGKAGELVAVVAGILIVFALAFIASRVFSVKPC